MSCNGARFRRAALILSVLLAAATVLVGVGGPAQAADADPPAGSFYDPPSPLPAGAPDDLIRYRRIGDVAGAHTWLVLYHSRNALNRRIAVSGLVMVPKSADPRTVPIVGVGPGTAGLGDACAASKSPASTVAQAAGPLARGWAVAVTDYEGLGTPGLHTYQVGRSEGRAVLDVVRAAQRLPGAGLGRSNPVGLWGYSQGGGAIGWAAQLQPAYAPELPVKGVVAGGVPADLLQVATLHGNDTLGFGLLPMTALGMDAAYPDIHLDSLLNPLGRTLLGQVSQLCLGDALLLMTRRTIAQLTIRSPLDDATFVRRVNENRLGGIAPRAPVLLYHGTVDEGVPIGQARNLAREWCARGAQVTWRTYPGEHVTTGAVGQIDGAKFLTSRFDGKTVGGNC